MRRKPQYEKTPDGQIAVLGLTVQHLYGDYLNLTGLEDCDREYDIFFEVLCKFTEKHELGHGIKYKDKEKKIIDFVAIPLTEDIRRKLYYAFIDSKQKRLLKEVNEIRKEMTKNGITEGVLFGEGQFFNL